MWRNIKVSHRILLGYMLILGLTLVLVVFFFRRVEELSRRIEYLNRVVAAEVDAGETLVDQVALTQQAVDRYLQQPQSQQHAEAETALRNLSLAVANAHDQLPGTTQEQRLDELAAQIGTYTGAFQTMVSLLENEQAIRTELHYQLFTTSTNLNALVVTYLRSDTPDPTVVDTLVTTQTNLQRITLGLNELPDADLEQQERQVLRGLEQTDRLLRSPTITGSSMAELAAATQADIAIISQEITAMVDTMQAVQQQRNNLLHERGTQLQQQADSIARDALGMLPAVAHDLRTQTRQDQQVVALALGLALVLAFMAATGLARTITQPLEELVQATDRLNRGDFTRRIPRTDWSEIGRLARAFNRMTHTLKMQRDELLRGQADLEQRNRDLEYALAEIKTSAAAREALSATIRTLSVPVVPILEHVLVVPLVGDIDAERAHLLLDHLLRGIAAQRARIAILDVTGVPCIDSTTADWLLQATQAARLLGARCFLVGIRPEVAEALVASGADLTDLTTRADLRSAVEYALRTTRQKG
jgi:rsbT co-antagonist protein RsbR